MMDMKQVVTGIELSEYRTISPDEDSKKEGKKKTVLLKVKYDGLTLGDVFTKAFKSDVVAWQNGSGGRKNFDNIVDKATICVSAKSPGAGPQIDPLDAVLALAKAAGVTPEQYLRGELKKRSEKTEVEKG